MADWTQAELDAIQTALRQGVRSIKYRDRVVEFRDLDEMRAIIAQGQRAVSGSARRHRNATTARGYYE